MEQPERKRMRLAAECYNQNGAYFITICTRERKKILSRICAETSALGRPQIQLLPHGAVADKYIRQMGSYYKEISVDNYVIMPDHIHLLVSISDSGGHPGTGAPIKRTSVIGRFVGSFKRFCNREYGENIWQGRYYDHVVRNWQDYEEIWRYIENNPRKKYLQEHGEPIY